MPSSPPHQSPVRGLGAFDASMVVVGSIVGSGIFVVSGEVAKNVASPAAFFGVWVAGGLLALAGALCNGELGALFPRGGGEYNYLRAAYGAPAGFLSGWTSFWVGFPGSIATIAAAFGRSVGDLLGNPPGVEDTLVATAAVLVLTALNAFGIRPGKWAQNLLSLSKLLAFAVLLSLGLLLGRGDSGHFAPFLGEGESWSALAIALIPVSFAYSGWNAATYVAGEIRQPERNLARALGWGTAVCVVLYLAVNAVYLYALPLEGMRGATNVAVVAATRLFAGGTAGEIARLFLAALVPVVLLSSLQAAVLGGPRICQAMAEDGLFPAALGRLHPISRVPVVSLVVQGGLATVLLWSGTFSQLLTLTTFAILLFATLTVVAVYVLRWRRPDLHRPFRTPGYPVTPALFVLGNLWILGNVVAGGGVEVLGGVGIVAAGIPVYLLYRRRRGSGRAMSEPRDG